MAGAEPTVNAHQSHLARCQVDIGILLRDMGNTAEALKVHESALAISQKLADANPTVTGYQDELAGKYANMGVLLRVPESRRRRRTRSSRRSKSDRSWPMPTPLSSISKARLQVATTTSASCCGRTGKMDEARKAGELALAIRRRLVRERPTRPAS